MGGRGSLPSLSPPLLQKLPRQKDLHTSDAPVLSQVFSCSFRENMEHPLLNVLLNPLPTVRLLNLFYSEIIRGKNEIIENEMDSILVAKSGFLGSIPD